MGITTPPLQNDKNNDFFKEFSKGIFDENPVFIIIIGLFPSLAVTTIFIDSFVLGIIAILILFFSSIIISFFKKIVPSKLRTIFVLLVIAVFVTVSDILIRMFLPKLSVSLGIYLPLLTINCFIIGRKYFLSENISSGSSILNSIGMGVGFTFGLSIIGFIREIIGKCSINLSNIGIDDIIFNNSNFVIEIFNKKIEVFSGVEVFILPAGAFFVIGLILALINSIRKKEITVKD
jgi:Na+-translocating ferredoxin:NAD+ oxidoreductase subunit E